VKAINDIPDSPRGSKSGPNNATYGGKVSNVK